MKIIESMSLTEGFEAPSTEHVTTDMAVLDTRDLLLTHAAESPLSLPHQLVIRTRPEPVPLQDLSATVSLLSQGEVLTPQALYTPDTVNHAFTHDVTNCQFEGIRLHYESSAWADLLSFQPGDMLYEKPFAVQRGRSIQETRQNPREDPRLLYGYGGVFTEGLAVHHIQQVYFELFEGLQRTEVTLTSESQWLERGVVPLTTSQFRGQQVITDDNMTYQQSLNLGAALVEGYAQFQVTDPPTQELVSYTSCEVNQPHNHPNCIDITFQKQGGDK